MAGFRKNQILLTNMGDVMIIKQLKHVNKSIHAACLPFLLLCSLIATGCDCSESDSDKVSDSAYYQDGGNVTLSGQEYSSAVSDENAVKVYNGGALSLTDSTVTKTGETSDRENSGFYGFNSAVLASSSSSKSGYTSTGADTEITMSDSTITTDASGANGAFAFGENAVITLTDVTIETICSDNSRGVDI